MKENINQAVQELDLTKRIFMQIKPSRIMSAEKIQCTISNEFTIKEDKTMTTKYTKNGSETVYNDAEWNFIETLPENCKRNILRGLATPYDYGYVGECLGMWEATPEEQEEINDILAELGI